jgi:hypothetical protein
MPTTKTQERPNRRQAHKPNGPDAASERCPWCGSKISRAEYQRIREKITEQERGRLAEVEQTLRQRFGAEQQKAMATAKAEVEKAKRDAAAQIEKARKEAAARETAIRKQAAESATAALAPKIAEAVAAERKQAFAEKLKINERLENMKREIERSRAFELGDSGELDLLTALTQQFSAAGDKISRVPKGRNGPDILHDVVLSGNIIGRIIYDSKNHKKWQSVFTRRLRQHMIDQGADHAILSTATFPAHARQIVLQDGVVVAAPGRVVVLAELLRRQVITMHSLRLTNQARIEKTAELYSFITSDRFTHLFDQLEALTHHMLELDAKETSAHQTTWKRRGELIRAIQRLNVEFTGEVERIIGTGSQSEAAGHEC